MPLRLSPFEPDATPPTRPRRASAGDDGRGVPPAWRAQFGVTLRRQRAPRVVLQFPQNPNDMLLSGTLANGQVLSNRAALVDAPLGKGHVVMFAIRPFWRWQTQGTYSLGFNAIMNWNDLDAGKTAPAREGRRRRSLSVSRQSSVVSRQSLESRGDARPLFGSPR